MPELPEVETIRRGLLPRLEGRTIERVLICPDPRGCRTLRRYPSVHKFARRLKNKKITSLQRKAKYLLCHLDSKEILIIHLGMSGRLLLLAADRPFPPHTRLVLKLAGGEHLCLIDPRKFGEVYLFSEKRKEVRVNPFRLGPDPLGKSFTPQQLEKILSPRKAAIKSALLNQKAIAGLGNIYSDEALFRARIHPFRKSSQLSPTETRRLHAAIREVLAEAIRLGGTTAANGQYRDSRDQAGKFQNRLNVYQRKGENCRRCRGPIQTLKIGGRTAHFCPRCQK